MFAYLFGAQWKDNAKATIAARPSADPTIGYMIIRRFVVPKISRTPLKTLPTENAAIAEFHRLTDTLSGVIFFSAATPYGKAPNRSGIENA